MVTILNCQLNLLEMVDPGLYVIVDTAWIVGKDFWSIFWTFYVQNYLILQNLLAKQLPDCMKNMFCMAKLIAASGFKKRASADVSY